MYRRPPSRHFDLLDPTPADLDDLAALSRPEDPEFSKPPPRISDDSIAVQGYMQDFDLAPLTREERVNRGEDV